MRIKSVSVQGIRGFNKPEHLDLSDGLTLLYGQNGTGKSSFLQSIEWAITGGIPSMKGGDFTREDAIVNLFAKSKKAIVEIELSNQGESITISRSRKMSTKTALGRQPLEVKSGDKTLMDEEAELHLQRQLKIDPEGFSQSKYIHQETIREILNAKPEERSQAINKIIGTYEIREFAKTIDVDRRINSSIKGIEETLDLFRRDKIQFLRNLRRSLEEKKKALLQEGKSEQDLSVSATMDKMTRLKEGVNQLGKRFSARQLADVDIQPNAQSLIQAQEDLVNQLYALDRARLESLNRLRLQKNSLSMNTARYQEKYSQLKMMRETDAAALTERMAQINDEVSKMSESVKDLRQKLVSLPRKRSIYELNKSSLILEKNKLKEITARFGNAEEIERRLEKTRAELVSSQNELERLSNYETLLSLAIEHLKVAKNRECPVCSQEIDNEQLIDALRLKVDEDMVASIKKAKEFQKTAKSDLNLLEETLVEIKNRSDSVGTLETRVDSAAQQLRMLVPDLEKESLDDVEKRWEGMIQDFVQKESELRKEEREINEVIARRAQITNEISKVEGELQRMTSTSFEGIELVDAAQKASQHIDSQIAEFSDSSEIDEFRSSLNSLSGVLDYLKDESQVLSAEAGLPTVEKQISNLEARFEKLQALAVSLQSIRQIVTLYEKEASIAELDRLENDINSYYSQIQGHPYFSEIKIDVEKEDPLIFSIRAASPLEKTYIPTRFSTAQLNAVALAIFMSYNSQHAGELPIMILDDPTQNMDLAHKKAFAQLISSICLQRQVVIATEDDDTKRFLEEQCANTKTYEFVNWTLDGTNISAR